jgi:hypothetical protein
MGSDIFLIAGAMLGMLPLLLPHSLLAAIHLPAPVLALTLAILLFLPGTVALGAVTPFLAKDLEDKALASQIVARLSKASTIGSIAATVLMGSLLLGFFSHRTLLVVSSLVLIGHGVYGLRHIRKLRTALAGALSTSVGLAYLALVPQLAPFKDQDTLYDRYLIFDYRASDGEPHRVLQTGPNGVQNEIHLMAPHSVVADYLKIFQLDRVFKKNIAEALVIGGGVLTYPQYLARYFHARVDVAELDHALKDLAIKYFYAQPHPNITVHHQDGRVFLGQTETKYDAIYIDAFNGHTVPSHLVTEGMFRVAAARLQDDGLLTINLIDHLKPEAATLVAAVLQTLRSVFPAVRVIPESGIEPYGNWVVFAAKNPKILRPAIPQARFYQEVMGMQPGMLLTDDFAPTEHLAWNVGF